MAGGREISQWNMANGRPYAPCVSRGLTRPARAEETVADCLVFQTQAGAEVTGLQFGQFDSPYDLQDGDPIIWTFSRRATQ